YTTEHDKTYTRWPSKSARSIGDKTNCTIGDTSSQYLANTRSSVGCSFRRLSRNAEGIIILGQKPKDIRQEIARVVNSKHNTKWTELQVKSKIAYVRTKYREAAKMNSTGQGSQVSSKQLEVCPEFSRLHEVYGGNLAANPPPPKQSVNFGDGPAASEITDDESSDLDPHEDTFDNDSNAGSHAESSNVTPSNKRRKVNGSVSSIVLTNSIEELKHASDQHRQAYDESRNELRQREQTVEIREREVSEKLLRLAEDSNRLAEEARVRLREELAAERAEFRKEMAEGRAELKEDRAEFRREKAEFVMERDQLKMENAALRKELEVTCRTIRSPKDH
ncbi:hypothetical protein BGW39_002571, partial [Mortierella sp. 14UC]